MPIIEVKDVTKRFRLGRTRSLRQTMTEAFARLTGHGAGQPSEFNALDRVSFSIEPGEIVGIIGHNGAGKSTMLKLLAGISPPTDGSIRVHGRVAPLIEVGAGLVADLTGRENVYLNGAILGMKREEIRRKFDDIVQFAELEQFIDTPLKRYSSGMQMRLGFAIATAVDADILIVDEVLAVGDLAFQRKCYDRIQSMLTQQGRTVLLVAHNLREIERMCQRVILLDHGRVLMDGAPHDVCNVFYERSQAKMHEDAASNEFSRAHVMESGDIEILEIAVLDETGEARSTLAYDAPFALRLRVKSLRELTRVIFNVGVQTPDFLFLSTVSSEGELSIERLPPGEHEVSCHFERMPFLPGNYALRLEIEEGTPNHAVFYGENLVRFRVRAGRRSIPLVLRDGFVVMDATWSASASPAKVNALRRRAP
jgi:ABC-type polysaccharide/polyol phosphate transport system ATPase subunit